MEKEFIPYELAVKLKELGFDEPCLKSYGTDGLLNENDHEMYLSAPTFSQAFRWFREKHKGVHEIIRKEDGNHSKFIGWVYINNIKIEVVSYWNSKTYEESELECLKKLIEITKK